ncbi:hypothetical protein AX16_010566 [Volvariella volvacea WC 439]|nr:hypothetical protein AX16_010566 [Volvariella volvacea WC 439]
MLGLEHWDKVMWFNSLMTDAYKEEMAERLRNGELWGLFMTDSFGMEMGLPDITLVVQWRAAQLLAILWQ